MPIQRPPGREHGPAARATFAGFNREEPTLVPLNLREAFAVLCRHRLVVLAIALGAFPLAAYVWFTAVPTYRANAVIRLSDARGAITGGLVQGQLGGLGARSVDPLLSEVEVITSRATAAAVVDSSPVLRLDTRQVLFRFLGEVTFTSSELPESLTVRCQEEHVIVTGRTGEVRAKYGETVEIDGIRLSIIAKPSFENAFRLPLTGTPEEETGTIFVLGREQASYRLLRALRARPRANTDIIDISYVGRDPDRARYVVNRAAQVYQQVSAHAAQQASRLQREFIEAQLSVSDSLLAEARQALAVFRAGEGVYRAGAAQADVGALLVRRAELDAQRRLYEDLLRQLSDSTTTVRREALRATTAVPEVAANVEVAQLYTQLVQYETALDSLTTASASHPDVPRVEQLISNIEVRLVHTAESAVRSLITSLDARIATLDDFRQRSEATYRRFSAAQAEEARLVEQVETARTMTVRLREAHQKAQLAEAVEVGQVEIVALAAAAAPIGVAIARTIAMILVLGLVAGIGAAFLRERLHTSIRGQKELLSLGLPVLGVVPRLREKSNGAGSAVDAPVIEALRGIRLNMVHAHGAAGSLVATISSPCGGDGKSFIATNLALAFASAGHETLLIDGDTRRGILHELLRTKRKPGLTDYLLGSDREIIQETSFPHLHVIGCGARTSGAPEHLGSHRMRDLMLLLRKRFSVVLVDSPPIGAGVDALTLGTITGNMVLVVRSGNTSREVTETKIDIVDRLPIRLLGVIANAVRDGDADGYSGYYIEGYEFDEEISDDKPKLLKRAVSKKKKSGWAKKMIQHKHQV